MQSLSGVAGIAKGAVVAAAAGRLPSPADTMGPPVETFLTPVRGIEVTSALKPAELLDRLQKFPSLNAAVSVQSGHDGTTHVLVADRGDSLGHDRLEGVYGVMARLCSAPELKGGSPLPFQSPTQMAPNVYDVRLPGIQTAGTVAHALADGLKTNQTAQLQSLLDGLPQGKRVALLIGGPSSAGKSSLIEALKQMSPHRKIVYFSGDMFFRNVDDAQYPRTSDGDLYLDSPQAMHLDEMASAIAKLIQTGEADLPHFDFTMVPPGGPVKGYTGMRAAKLEHVTLGPDDILVIDSLHATNPAVINELTGLELPHASVYLDTPSANMRLVRRMVRDCGERGVAADRTLSGWDLSVFPGERDHIRPTLLQLDPASDLVYENRYPADVDLTRQQIDDKVRQFDKAGIKPSYAAFAS